ncbi:HNH endonuclease signature motif containing protein [Blastococcus sp. URHD0036]|uniref:HNH endonuclease signature motif containing protein n=1 Tax=Blastococcus sp. URHD0036 TaxID=1380356 RepID=UPI0012DD035F|nr:HNH endonuclease signature motif containing protein [Blastococcus sp. URHD0036]
MIDTDSPCVTGSEQLRELLDSGAAALSQALAAWRDEARSAARGVRALAAFARLRPHGALDRQPGEPGAMSATTRAARPEALAEVSEWAVDEVALALRMSAATASDRLSDALVLVERLPCTLALLEAAEISWAHARQMIAQVGPVSDDELRARIEARVLGLLKDKTPPQLGDCARRIVLREDADAAARRLVAAMRGRGVALFDRRDGSATLTLDLPLPVAVAIYRALEAHAEEARTEGDERTKQQRMADVVADLILRSGANGLPPVSIALTLVATLETMLGGSEPGQVEGHLVPAEAVRELGYAFGLMPRPAPAATPATSAPEQEPEPDQKPEPADSAEPEPEPEPEPDSEPDSEPEPEPTGEPGPDLVRAPSPGATPVRDRPLAEWMARAAARDRAAVDAALSGADRAIADGAWTDGEERALLDLGALIGVRDVAGTGLAHRPHIAVVDMLRGSLVALTDATGIRRGQALGPPTGSEAHDPSLALDRFVRLRDRRCRFPGCRARARVCDLDHQEPWPHGRTEHGNLCCLCEHHHRLKHQAPGWRFDATSESSDRMADDGALVVTTPSGDTRISRPPRFGTDLDVPPY